MGEWAAERTVDVALEAAPHAVVAGPDGELFATSPGHTWAIEADGTVRAGVLLGGDAIAWRTTRNGPEALICGPNGLQAVPFGVGNAAPRGIATEPCEAVAVRGGASPAVIVARKDGFFSYRIAGDGAFLAPDAIAVPTGSAPVLLVVGERVLAGRAGASTVVELGPRGRSELAGGGSIGAAGVLGERLVWTVPATAEIVDTGRDRVAIAAIPGVVASGDLDGDGGSDLWISHAGGRAGIVLADERVERIVAIPAGATSAAISDLNGDGCGDLGIGTAAGVQLVFGRCAGGTPAPTMAEPTMAEPTVAPTMAEPTVAEGGTPEPSAVDVAPEPLAVPVEPTVTEPPPVQADPLPAAATLADLPFSRAMRVEIVVGQRYAARLSPSERGVTYSGRGGPVGFVVLPDGAIRYTPSADQVGTWHITMRSTRLGLSSVGDLELVVLPDPNAPTTATTALEPDAPRTGMFTVDGCVAAFGAAAGASNGAGSWERLGRSPLLPSGSPAASLSCDVAVVTGVGLFFGGDTAPTFTYLADSESRFVHLAAATAGIGFGSDAVKVGPYATAGILISGVGLRAVVLPFHTAHGRSGFELRATALVPSAPAGEVMLMYAMQQNRR